jgi:hypothetical protein
MVGINMYEHVSGGIERYIRVLTDIYLYQQGIAGMSNYMTVSVGIACPCDVTVKAPYLEVLHV